MNGTTHKQLVRRWRLPLIVGLWLAAAVVGMSLLVDYASTPGAAAGAPERWPDGTEVDRADSGPTLAVFIHPRCPCTASTLAELERLVAELSEPVRTLLVFGCPEEEDESWAKARLWHRSGQIPGATRIIDRGGRLARRFGVTTSGHCLLYSGEGRLLFHGGITPSRGHEGDSYGRRAIQRLVNGQATEFEETPVFGCELIVSARQSDIRPVRYEGEEQ